MAVQRKRKHASAEEQAPQLAAGGQPGIASFGTIAKAHDVSAGQKKRKLAHQDQSTLLGPATQIARPKSKRKRGLEEDDVATQQPAQEAFTARNKRLRNTRPLSPAGTPSKCAADLFSNMRLGAASTPIPFALNTGAASYDTPPQTPDSQMDDSSQLPPEFDDLLLLQSAFLSALSMYYAHNGTSSSVEVRTLLEMITKHWKKRAVSVDDLRMLLAVDTQEEPEFQLKDYGRAGIRLIKPTPRGRAVKRSASYVDITDTSARFEDGLQKSWLKWLAVAPKESRLPSMFLEQLPLAAIEKDASVQNAAPIYARGQERLADLRASQATVAKESGSVVASTIEQKSPAAVQSRGASLLDRILAKQALSSTLPAGPTRDQLERKAALQRVEDIARVLELLAAGRPRCSFSMQGLAQQLQQSLRNPISREEIERCLALMANEITPGFVSLVCNAAMTGVVVTKSGKVGLEELRRRVQVACERAI